MEGFSIYLLILSLAGSTGVIYTGILIFIFFYVSYIIRYKNIFVLADNLNEEMAFGPQNILECVCVQHEICHLSGETMFDHEYTKTLLKN